MVEWVQFAERLGVDMAFAAEAWWSDDALDFAVSVRVEIGEDVAAIIDKRRAAVAFKMGGMSSATTNFYNDAFVRAGYADDAKAIQALWLDGKREARQTASPMRWSPNSGRLARTTWSGNVCVAIAMRASRPSSSAWTVRVRLARHDTRCWKPSWTWSAGSTPRRRVLRQTRVPRRTTPDRRCHRSVRHPRAVQRTDRDP